MLWVLIVATLLAWSDAGLRNDGRGTLADGRVQSRGGTRITLPVCSVASGGGGELVALGAMRSTITQGLSLQPIEEQLSIGSARFLRTVRRWTRRILRTISWSAQQWVDWSLSALGVVGMAFLTPLLDRQLLSTWRGHGFRAFRASLVLGLAVYIRLLFDRRAPAIGKVLLLCAVLYGVAPADLLPDRLGPLGLVDDLVFVGLASRVFTRLCPDRLVAEHAMSAARAWDRARRARLAAAGASVAGPSGPLG